MRQFRLNGKFHMDNLLGHPEPRYKYVIIPDKETPRNFKMWMFLQANNLWHLFKNVNTWQVF